MPRIHIIWDPKSSITPPPPDVSRQLGCKVALLDVNDDIQQHEIAKLSQELARMLLEQIAAGEPN